jgi:hypothetical protein
MRRPRPRLPPGPVLPDRLRRAAHSGCCGSPLLPPPRRWPRRPPLIRRGRALPRTCLSSGRSRPSA